LKSNYQIKIDEEALLDIKEATIWYNRKLDGLGNRFSKQVKKQINSLKNNPFICEIRYQNVCCFPIKNFPFMIHYTIEQTSLFVEIFAVYHTSRNPTIWEDRK